MTIRPQSIQPEAKYSQRNETEYRDSIRRSLLEAQNKRQAITMLSPNGSTFFLAVSDTGQLALISSDGTAIDVVTGGSINLDLGSFNIPTQGTNLDFGTI